MLAIGAASMAICHAIIAAIIAEFGDSFPTHKSAGNAAVFFVYFYICSFAVTWGPREFILYKFCKQILTCLVAWVVSAEVFPLDMRAKGMSFASATNWIMNFTVAQVTPVMITNIGYKTCTLSDPI